MLAILALAACAIGIIGGATSLGGVLLIPLLVFLSGLNTHEAMATALFSFFFAGLLSTYFFQKRGSMDWKITAPVCIGSLVSGYLGAMAGADFSAGTLQLALSAIIVVPSVISFFPALTTNVAGSLGNRGNTVLLLAVGLFVGFICGMTGAGGGIIALPLLLILGYPALASIGTGQILACSIALSGSISNFSNGFIDFPIAALLAVCSISGSFLGVRLVHSLPLPLVKKGVTLLCIATGLFIAVRVFV
ncbi:sulfite exporter TauE/SafE family protein [Desulfovibrio sp. OttesenSCG-928-C06]|nr:sulfite exporter TauE/SafE family protein [Desulfovibrio sp. OttesenSCG-928-C06]